MKTRLLLLVMVMLALPGAAMAQQVFDFYGMALLPAVEGESLTMYGIVREGDHTTTPIPLDFYNYEYTIAVTDLVLNTDANPQLYANGLIVLYQDSTPDADFGSPGTFTDGTVILSGLVTSLERWVFTSTLGNAMGMVDWTGGSSLNEMALEDQVGWAFLSPTNNSTTLVEAGYDEAWDGKVEPESPVVDLEKVSWDGLKAMF